MTSGHYVAVFTTVFAVMFNVEVFVSQGLGAFKPKSPRSPGNFFVGFCLVILAPVLFFAMALPVVEIEDKATDHMQTLTLFKILYWVTPVYGFQQLWYLIARSRKWTGEPLGSGESDGWIWWISASVVCGLFPLAWVVVARSWT